VKALAVIISGDDRWRDIEMSVGGWLAQRGVAVVGLDSPWYFWSKRDAAEVIADLPLLFDHYGLEFGTKPSAVIEYSFGADVMPNI
jgi:type IV secretory pathway VirJ component